MARAFTLVATVVLKIRRIKWLPASKKVSIRKRTRIFDSCKAWEMPVCVGKALMFRPGR
jgi:hypothetical protein